MYLLLVVDMSNVNLCYLLVIQCSQKVKKPLQTQGITSYVMLPSFYCHINIFSFVEMADAIDISTSRYVFPINKNKFIAIFLAFNTTNTPLIIFMMSLSIRVLQPGLSNYLIDKIFFFKPFASHTSKTI